MNSTPLGSIIQDAGGRRRWSRQGMEQLTVMAFLLGQLCWYSVWLGLIGVGLERGEDLGMHMPPAVFPDYSQGWPQCWGVGQWYPLLKIFAPHSGGIAPRCASEWGVCWWHAPLITPATRISEGRELSIELFWVQVGCTARCRRLPIVSRWWNPSGGWKHTVLRRTLGVWHCKNVMLCCTYYEAQPSRIGIWEGVFEMAGELWYGEVCKPGHIIRLFVVHSHNLCHWNVGLRLEANPFLLS